MSDYFPAHDKGYQFDVKAIEHLQFPPSVAIRKHVSQMAACPMDLF